MPSDRPSYAHPVRIAVVAVACMVVSGALAMVEPVPGWELDLTVWINDAPDWLARMLYPVMQLGTLAAPLLAAAVVLWRLRDRWTAAALIVAGLASWFGAKAIKSAVERGRPLQYLPEIAVREGDGAGLGYVSGHAAVAATTATIVVPLLPRRWRPVPVVLAGLVGVGRIVHGVHLPADVVGGWAFGTLVGLGAVLLLGRVGAEVPVQVSR